jgi:hypothetical protein
MYFKAVLEIVAGCEFQNRKPKMGAQLPWTTDAGADYRRIRSNSRHSGAITSSPQLKLILRSKLKAHRKMSKSEMMKTLSNGPLSVVRRPL